MVTASNATANTQRVRKMCGTDQPRADAIEITPAMVEAAIAVFWAECELVGFTEFTFDEVVGLLPSALASAAAAQMQP